MPDYGWKGNALDSKDARPVRPSLFEAGKPAASGAGEARPAMAGLGDDPVEGRARSRVRLPAVFASVVIAMLVCAVAVWWWRDGDAAHGPAAQARVVDAVAAPSQDASTAVLVEGGSADATAASDPIAMIRARAGDPVEAAPDGAVGAPGGLAATTGPAGRGAEVRSSTPRTVQASRSSQPPRRATATSDADLLATLLANIRDRPSTASAQPQTLDELIAQLRQQDPDPRAKAGAGATADTGATAMEGGSARLQTRLRSCPAANTLEGIRCRQKLCAQFRGDPACPRQ